MSNFQYFLGAANFELILICHLKLTFDVQIDGIADTVPLRIMSGAGVHPRICPGDFLQH
jgi:hypothetical protein